MNGSVISGVYDHTGKHFFWYFDGNFYKTNFWWKKSFWMKNKLVIPKTMKHMLNLSIGTSYILKYN